MLASRLVTGLADVESAKPSLEMWRLSREVAGSRTLSGMFERYNDRELYFELSRARKGSAGKRFLLGLRAFLDSYGHRGFLEAEMMKIPTWNEDPSYVLGMIRSTARANPEKDPGTTVERQRLIREEAEAEALSRLGFHLRPVFTRILGQARTYIKCREEAKALIVESAGQLRRYLETLKREMVKRGWINTGEDIYFLTCWDLKKIGEGELVPAETMEIVQRRRSDFKWCSQVRMPNIIEGKAMPMPEDKEPPLRTANSMAWVSAPDGLPDKGHLRP